MKKSKPKYSYEIDPYNNLIVSSGEKTSARYFRKVVSGKFRTDKKNQLEYVIRRPLDNKDIPKVIRLTGKWSLTENHDLKLTLSEDKKQLKTITIKGQLMETGKNSISFSVFQKTAVNKERVYVLKLEGFWQVDKYNRITFKVKKEKGKIDKLSFICIWSISKKNSILYTFSRADHLTGLKTKHTIEFKGVWKITEKNRITYVICSRAGSEFSIKTTAQKFEKNSIKASIGVGFGKNKKGRQITLFGEWKINKNIGLFFVLKNENNKQKYIKFGCEAMLKNTAINFNMKAYGTKKDLDIRLKLKRDMKTIDGQLFAEVFKNKKETAIFFGVGGRF